MYVYIHIPIYLTKIKNKKEAMYLKKNKVGRTFERAWREEREGQRCDYTISLKIKTNKKHVREIEQVAIIPTQKETSQPLRFGVTFSFIFIPTHTSQ